MIRYISGIVIDGDKIGRTLWFPTANIAFKTTKLPSSVFQVNVCIEGKIYGGMGVHALWKKTFEVHIFDFDVDIYGKNIEIYLLKEIRPNKKFDSLQDLSEQLKQDKSYIQKLETKVLTFGTFDVFHKWHEHYLNYAKRYGTMLHTIIARDKTVEKIKGFIPKHNESERKNQVQKSWIPDSVILGDLEDPLVPVRLISPDIICLGYDQKSFPKHLTEYVDITDIDVIRIESFQPDIYKSSKLK